jgi:hypothetical protein
MKTNKICESHIPPRTSGTRDAVESAIDISKGDKAITWERALEDLDRVSSWEVEDMPNGKAASTAAGLIDYP